MGYPNIICFLEPFLQLICHLRISRTITVFTFSFYRFFNILFADLALKKQFIAHLLVASKKEPFSNYSQKSNIWEKRTVRIWVQQWGIRLLGRQLRKAHFSKDIIKIHWISQIQILSNAYRKVRNDPPATKKKKCIELSWVDKNLIGLRLRPQPSTLSVEDRLTLKVPKHISHRVWCCVRLAGTE